MNTSYSVQQTERAAKDNLVFGSTTTNLNQNGLGLFMIHFTAS